MLHSADIFIRAHTLKAQQQSASLQKRLPTPIILVHPIQGLLSFPADCPNQCISPWIMPSFSACECARGHSLVRETRHESGKAHSAHAYEEWTCAAYFYNVPLWGDAVWPWPRRIRTKSWTNELVSPRRGKCWILWETAVRLPARVWFTAGRV